MHISSDYINLYALYRGDTFIDVGTLAEMSERLSISKNRLYRFLTYAKTNSRKCKYKVYYIGKELKPMYERLMKRLSKMRQAEADYARKSVKERYVEKHIIREEAITEVMQIVDILCKEEEEYEEAEREGRYYQ